MAGNDGNGVADSDVRQVMEMEINTGASWNAHSEVQPSMTTRTTSHTPSIPRHVPLNSLSSFITAPEHAGPNPVPSAFAQPERQQQWLDGSMHAETDKLESVLPRKSLSSLRQSPSSFLPTSTQPIHAAPSRSAPDIAVVSGNRVQAVTDTFARSLSPPESSTISSWPSSGMVSTTNIATTTQTSRNDTAECKSERNQSKNNSSSRLHLQYSRQDSSTSDRPDSSASSVSRTPSSNDSGDEGDGAIRRMRVNGVDLSSTAKRLSPPPKMRSPHLQDRSHAGPANTFSPNQSSRRKSVDGTGLPERESNTTPQPTRRNVEPAPRQSSLAHPSARPSSSASGPAGAASIAIGSLQNIPSTSQRSPPHSPPSSVQRPRSRGGIPQSISQPLCVYQDQAPPSPRTHALHPSQQAAQRAYNQQGKTYPPATGSFRTEFANAVLAQRNSAPSLSQIAAMSSDDAIGKALNNRPSTSVYTSAQNPSYQPQNFTEVLRDSAYSASPVVFAASTLDAGFGSSSPYPPIGGAGSNVARYSHPVGGPTAYAMQPPQAAAMLQSRSTALNVVQPSPVRPYPNAVYEVTQGSAGLTVQRPAPAVHPRFDASQAISADPSGSSGRQGYPAASYANNADMGASSNMAGIGVNGSVLAPAAVQSRAQPDVIRPMGQEICLECLMRDRDMADVEVTGPGIWSRASDLDYEEALKAEDLAIAKAQSQARLNATGSSGDDPGPPSGTPYTEESGNGASRESGGTSDERVLRSRSTSFPNLTIPRRKIGGGGLLTAPSLKLWTSMNQVTSQHRYQVLKDFVREQNGYLRITQYAREQAAIEQIRDNAMPGLRAVESISRMVPQSPGRSAAYSPPVVLESRRKTSVDQLARPLTVLPKGTAVETLNVAHDAMEAKVRAKAQVRHSKKPSTSSPPAPLSTKPGVVQKRRSQHQQLSPNSATFNPAFLQDDVVPPPSPIGGYPAPWSHDSKRRFSSPLLTSKIRNASMDNIAARSRSRQDGVVNDLRMSTHSAMLPRQADSLSVRNAGFRSPSPSRQSFVTTGNSSPSGERSSKAWRRSFWNSSRSGSAAASVISFGGGSMLEMHLGMSQDKHNHIAPSATAADYGAFRRQTHNPGGTWPDNASLLDESGGISPDENVAAAKSAKKKKKGFKKFVNSLFGSQHNNASAVDRQDVEQIRAAHLNNAHEQSRRGVDRRESGLTYSAAQYNDDSEPLAPPPPLSYLTGQPPHRRSFSSSSQSSATSPVLAPAEHTSSQPLSARNTSLGVPTTLHTGSSNGFISPSTSSSDLARQRPSSVTSWRSSIKTGNSPQSPQAGAMSMPAIRQSSYEELLSVKGMATMHVDAVRVHEVPADHDRLKREKSLPALPPPQNSDDAQYTHAILPAFSQRISGRDRSLSSVSSVLNPRSVQSSYGTNQPQYAQQYSPEMEDYQSISSQSLARSKKSKSRLFGFGSKKSRQSLSPPPPADGAAFASQAYGQQYPQRSQQSPEYILPNAGLQGVARDSHGDLVAYRHPSVAY